MSEQLDTIKLNLIAKKQYNNESVYIKYEAIVENNVIGDCYIYLGNDELYRFGNLGYGIGSEYQNRGYGTKLCRMLLDELHKNGLSEAVVVVEDTNIYSKAIVKKFHGLKKAKTINDGKKYTIYIIKT